MIILLDGKGLEPALPDVSTVMPLVAPNMGCQEPVHPAAQVPILGRPKGQVEMIGHQTIGQHPHGIPEGRLGNEMKERVVIAILPMNYRVSFCIFVHFYLPPPVHEASGIRAPAQRLPKTERALISTSGPSISLFTEPGDSCGQINPFLPTRRRPTVDHSLVAGGAQRHQLQACLPDGH